MPKKASTPTPSATPPPCATSQHEAVAVVVLTGDLPGARRCAAEPRGGAEYLAGTFDGPAMKKLRGFVEGEGLEASLFRIPASRNARLEFARPVNADGKPIQLAEEPSRRRAAVSGLLVDLDDVLRRVSTHGGVTALDDLAWLRSSRRPAHFDTSYDDRFMLGSGTSGR